jgi:hypothetical protein
MTKITGSISSGAVELKEFSQVIKREGSESVPLFLQILRLSSTEDFHGELVVSDFDTPGPWEFGVSKMKLQRGAID